MNIVNIPPKLKIHLLDVLDNEPELWNLTSPDEQLLVVFDSAQSV